MMTSRAARILAVRKVTQDNRGKKTAGVDRVASLTPPQRLKLARDLEPTPTGRPVRRVWIPKPGKAEKRPLGIPTMRDRAAQTLVRLALEPEWEARFEPNSYGFRPGRSAHDAIQAVYNGVKAKAKYVLDADIQACFDRISHAALLDKLNTFPTLRRAIRGWLKAGIMEGKELFPSEEGTPQGGAISPLLANIALHGLESSVRAAFPASIRVNGERRANWKPFVVRYADDFVVLHEDRAVIEQARLVAARWLAQMGLELKPSKTRIAHTLDPLDGRAGFDFLGFHVRQYRVGRTRTSRATNGAPLGFKAIIRPSAEKQQQHLAALAEVVRRHRQAPQETLIERLTPKIRGWAAYYRTQPCSEVFSRMDSLLYEKLRRWARRRHPKKSAWWISRHYWRTEGGRNWVFRAPHGKVLVRHTNTHRAEHVKVAGSASPYDGNWLYWATRLGHHPELSDAKAALLRRQHGRCTWCGLFFTDIRQVMESDHRRPRSLGGRDGDANRDLLHPHCHDQKTATDGSNRPWSAQRRARTLARRRAGGAHAKSLSS
jgi:RNA-directed DNA polymerase